MAAISFEKTYDNRLLLIGPTLSKRMLAIVLGTTKRKGRYYLVTARSASKKEIRLYEDEQE
jgi:uncharacterized DUF497 family protein